VTVLLSRERDFVFDFVSECLCPKISICFSKKENIHLLIIFGLFNNALCISGCMSLSDRMITEKLVCSGIEIRVIL
jgi:hypothetical protein